MSHFSKIKAKITDEEALRAATTKMGLNLIRNGNARYYSGTQHADLVIKLRGRYDVALNRNADGYEMQADLYSGNVEKEIGPNAGLLMQRYAAEKTRIEAFKRALSVCEKEEGNDIILTLLDSETGGQIQVVCHMGGETEVRTSGFPGQSCMKFSDLETALGSRESFSPTMEMYDPESNMDERIFVDR